MMLYLQLKIDTDLWGLQPEGPWRFLQSNSVMLGVSILHLILFLFLLTLLIIHLLSLMRKIGTLWLSQH